MTATFSAVGFGAASFATGPARNRERVRIWLSPKAVVIVPVAALTVAGGVVTRRIRHGPGRTLPLRPGC
jgi:hypothetical protein